MRMRALMVGVVRAALFVLCVLIGFSVHSLLFIESIKVTGFGILGHAQNLCDNQVEAVGMELHTLPFIKKTPLINNEVFNFRLMVCYSAETSGGLMISMPADKAE